MSTSQQVRLVKDFTGNQKEKRFWTNRLFAIGAFIIVSTFLLAAFWSELGFSSESIIWLSIAMIVAFGINIAGLILGFIEIKRNFIRGFLGIMGNVCSIGFFLLMVTDAARLLPNQL